MAKGWKMEIGTLVALLRSDMISSGGTKRPVKPESVHPYRELLIIERRKGPKSDIGILKAFLQK